MLICVNVCSFCIPQYDMWHHHSVCAGPNSPAPGAMASIEDFVKLGAEPMKFILGMPWYGYIYACNDSLAYPSKFKPCDDPGLGPQHCLVGTLDHQNEQSSTAVNWWQMDYLLNGTPLSTTGHERSINWFNPLTFDWLAMSM